MLPRASHRYRSVADELAALSLDPPHRAEGKLDQPVWLGELILGHGHSEYRLTTPIANLVAGTFLGRVMAHILVCTGFRAAWRRVGLPDGYRIGRVVGEHGECQHDRESYDSCRLDVKAQSGGFHSCMTLLLVGSEYRVHS